MYFNLRKWLLLIKTGRKKILAEQGINCRVVDLRWLAPLDEQGILEQVTQCSNILIVDECRQTGSISEALMTLIHEAHAKKMIATFRILAD